MKRVASSRRSHVDLLRRRPRLDPVVAPSPAAAAVSRVDHLRVLLHLVERGVLSAEELERQQESILRPPLPYSVRARRRCRRAHSTASVRELTPSLR